jgi:hypothetical protein
MQEHQWSRTWARRLNNLARRRWRTLLAIAGLVIVLHTLLQ